MNKQRLIEKSITIAIIVLFLSMSIITSAGTGNIKIVKNRCDEKISTDNNDFIDILNLQDPAFPTLHGIKGENDWYISCVTLDFWYDPDIVDEIWYRIGDGNWQKYQDNPIEICDNGKIIIPWKWINHGGEEYLQTPIFIKIDQTPPTNELTKIDGLNDKVTFTANCEDDVSEVERVEFYLDDELQETCTEAPYKWTWNGTEEHIVYAIGYNYAGLEQKSNELSTPRYVSYYHQFIDLIVQRFFQRFAFLIK